MLDNIAFFRIYDKNIAQALQNTLEGRNKRYKLLFGDDINIIDIKNNLFLYPKDSFLNTAVNIATNPLNNALWNVFANNLTLLKVAVKNLTITSNAINKIVDIALMHDDMDTKIYHLPQLFLPQTNIFGLCGGVFLQILLECGYRFHSLLVFEEDIELFALSCYFVDYKMLFSSTSPKSCYIFISNINNKNFLNHYFYRKKITNNFLRLELNMSLSSKTTMIKNMVIESYKANSRGWGSFEDEMIGITNTLHNIKRHKALRLDTKINIPVCVVGSGPSLEYNIEFLKQNQDNMLIFSCGTALKILKKHNINIDFQIEIERVSYLGDVLDSSNLGDTPILCASVVDSSVSKIAKELYLFVRGGSASSYMLKNAEVIEFCAPFVGNAGFSLACKISDEIILCGIDCGYIKNHAKHTKDSFYGNESTEIPNDCFKVEGNSDIEVYSNSIFSLSKESLHLAINHYKPKKVYNIGQGAYIKGTIPAKNLRLQTTNKNNIKDKLLESSYKIHANKQDISAFCDDLKALLDARVKNKQELFAFVDKITAFLMDSTINKPYCGILFEGSVSHLLQNVLIALLHTQTNDIESDFCLYKQIIRDSIDQMILDYHAKIG